MRGHHKDARTSDCQSGKMEETWSTMGSSMVVVRSGPIRTHRPCTHTSQHHKTHLCTRFRAHAHRCTTLVGAWYPRPLSTPWTKA